MADYKIEIKKSVAKEIKSLPNNVLKRIVEKIKTLTIDSVVSRSLLAW